MARNRTASNERGTEALDPAALEELNPASSHAEALRQAPCPGEPSDGTTALANPSGAASGEILRQKTQQSQTQTPDPQKL